MAPIKPLGVFVSQDVEQRNGDITYGQFAQLYRSLMFSAQKMVRAEFSRAGKQGERLYLLLGIPS